MEEEFWDEIFMKRCLTLAKMGAGRVLSNPMVGSVIIHKNQVVSEGYHESFGGPHAEPNAINSLKNKELLKECTLYVNLEPCAHFGKTPPCVDLIIASQIPKVIIGTKDPNPLVSGKGIDILQKAGINVKTGILQKECEWLNRRFFTFHGEKRTYVVLKWAQSTDGFVDIIRKPETPVGPHWITNEPARQLVHKWRSMEMAIMTGTNTVLFDNPRLDVREWPGKNPVRVILDRSLRLPEKSFVFDQSVPTIVFTEKEKKPEENLAFFNIKFNEKTPVNILEVLYKKGIQSVFVEGGAGLLQSFINLDLWDEARIFYGKNEFKKGIPAPDLKNHQLTEDNNIGDSKYKLFIRKK
jgi:diaminohydroxyphosphoribosylaminopyrimidine deaminase / 5-amino-6-(5-phosphoribosylamino)uracil reductase